MNDLLEDGEINPWVNSNFHSNKTAIMRRIISENKISVILQSQSFAEDDGLLEYSYPHAQDDDCIVVKKSSEMEFHVQLAHVMEFKAWVFYFVAPFGKLNTKTKVPYRIED